MQKTFADLFEGFRKAGASEAKRRAFKHHSYAVVIHPNGLLSFYMGFNRNHADLDQINSLLKTAKKIRQFDSQEGPASHYNSPLSPQKWLNIHFIFKSIEAAIEVARAFAEVHKLGAKKIERASSKPVRLEKVYRRAVRR